MAANFPIQHSNKVLEKSSERYFLNTLPIDWIVDKPIDYGLDLIVNIVSNNEVIGLNFSVQLKSKKRCNSNTFVSLKKTTLNYIFSRLEPTMLVLYDEERNIAYWKWLNQNEFDLTKSTKNYQIKFDNSSTIENVNWSSIKNYVQAIFKVQKRLLTALEYDLFDTKSELEAKAWAHYFNSNFPEAIFNFNRLLNIESKAIWLLAKAQCEYALFNYSNALYTINLAIELDNSEDILLTKGCILAEDGIKNNDKYKQRAAERIFKQLYELKHTSTNCYNYANTSAHIGEIERAEALYKEALSMMPNYAEAWKNLGQIYQDKEEYIQALKCYDNALAINPNLYQAITSKGITLGIGLDRYEEGLLLLNKSIEINKNSFLEFPDIYFWMSIFYSNSGDIDNAFLWVNYGLNNSPGNFRLRSYKLSLIIRVINSHKHHLDDACDFLLENYSVNPDDSVNYYYICEIFGMKYDNQSKEKKIYDWFIAHSSIPVPNLDKILVYYEWNELLNTLKYWNSFRGYLSLNNINFIKLEFETRNLNEVEDFIYIFHINRIILASDLMDLFENNSEVTLVRAGVIKLFNDFLNRFPEGCLGKIIGQSDDIKLFGERFATVAIFCTEMVYKEWH